MAFIGFEFGFAGASGADAAAEPGEGLAHAGQTCQTILILRKADLNLTFGSAGASGENLQNQHGPVNDFAVGDVRDIAHLHSGQFGIENQHVCFCILNGFGDFFEFSGTDTGSGFRSRSGLNTGHDGFASGSIGKFFEFLHGDTGIIFAGIKSHKNGFRFLDFLLNFMHRNSSLFLCFYALRGGCKLLQIFPPVWQGGQVPSPRVFSGRVLSLPFCLIFHKERILFLS